MKSDDEVLTTKNAFNKSPIEIAFLKRKSKDECYLYLKKHINKIYKNDVISTGICALMDEADRPAIGLLESLGIKSPFKKEFYKDLKNIKLIKNTAFSVTESIIDIDSSFTVFQGRYKDQNIIVKEIFEEYTNVRQCTSYIYQLKTYETNFAKEHDSFMDLLAVSLADK